MMEMLIRWENLAMEVMLIESVFQMRNKAVIGTDAICVNYNTPEGCSKQVDKSSGGCQFKNRVMKHLCATVLHVASGNKPTCCGGPHAHPRCPKRT